MSNSVLEESSQQPETNQSEAANLRQEHLLLLLEEDALGYRLERFVAQTRETLAEALSGQEFSVALTNLSYQYLLGRVQTYDSLILPFVSFFAIGATYSKPEDASLWADFLERVATCNQHHQGTYNDALRKMSLYPALHLLYGAGILAVARRRWTTVSALLYRLIAFEHREEGPFVLFTNPFEIVPEQTQKAIPGREREYTPLLNHLYEILKPSLLPYFLDEARYFAAFTYFEVILATSFGHAYREQKLARTGKIPDDLWVPPARFWRQNYGQGTSVNHLMQEAKSEQERWPPIRAGLYSGKIETFLDLAGAVQALAAKSVW